MWTDFFTPICLHRNKVSPKEGFLFDKVPLVSLTLENIPHAFAFTFHFAILASNDFLKGSPCSWSGWRTRHWISYDLKNPSHSCTFYCLLPSDCRCSPKSRRTSCVPTHCSCKLDSWCNVRWTSWPSWPIVEFCQGSASLVSGLCITLNHVPTVVIWGFQILLFTWLKADVKESLRFLKIRIALCCKVMLNVTTASARSACESQPQSPWVLLARFWSKFWHVFTCARIHLCMLWESMAMRCDEPIAGDSQ